MKRLLENRCYGRSVEVAPPGSGNAQWLRKLGKERHVFFGGGAFDNFIELEGFPFSAVA